MEEKNNNKKGFIRAIIIIIIALAIAKFVFNFNIIDFFKSPKAHETLVYVGNVIKLVWEKYISVALKFGWDSGKVLLTYAWDNLSVIISKAKS